MKILLHVCCGPCALHPLQMLRDKGHSVEGYFYNPNIHPFKEFRRRVSALEEMAGQENFTVDIDDNYGLTEYLRKVVFNETARCSICYDMRLEQVAERASVMGVDAFTTTLLFSRYQNHNLIREKGESLARKHRVSFFYEDFRMGWQEGIERSKDMGLYRQPYCGCIYSEQERYDRISRRKNNNRQEYHD